MIKNVGKTDKIARIILGVVIISLGLYLRSWWGLLGLAILVSGLLNFCSLYKLFGISTCKEEKDSTPPTSSTPPTPPIAN